MCKRALILAVLFLLPGCLGGGPESDSFANPSPDSQDVGSAPDGGADVGEPEADADASTSPDVADEVAAGQPCLTATPGMLDFGGKLVGNTATLDVLLSSCGDAPVVIHRISLSDAVGLSSDFELDLGDLPGMASGTSGLAETDPPVSLAAGQTAMLTVRYTPASENPVDDEGMPIADEQLIRIGSDASEDDLEIAVSGFGVVNGSPTAVIKVAEGVEVIPQTKLHLNGSQSTVLAGNVAKYEWTVEQPAGSQSVFLPNAAAPDPTFEVNVAGHYVFRLDVWDEDNVKSPIAAEFQVVVVPDEAIHVELLWHTPGDEDETDEGPEAGADLDLHFAHQFAGGETDADEDGVPDGWFDTPYDTYWFSPNPNWGSFDPMIDDDPGLDRDDTDGAGPENLNLNIPADTTYKVGVHYWQEHGFGESYATVRVYIDGVMVFEVSGVELHGGDLWEVATIDWPSGTVTPIEAAGGEPKIMASYPTPFDDGM